MMRSRPAAYFFAAFLLFAISGITAQASKTNQAKATASYPASFAISKAEFDQLFGYQPNTTLNLKKNKYLDKAVLLMHSETGDMKFIKLKLAYFRNAELMVQVNGGYSTQAFIMSADNSVFYKGEFVKGNLVMTKCHKDDIMSE